MKAKNTVKFELYVLDMWGDAEEGWWENNRISIGELTVPCDDIGQFAKRDILKAMKRKRVRPVIGFQRFALHTMDKKIVFIEETADGWFEIGLVRDHKPVYGLRLKEEKVHE